MSNEWKLVPDASNMTDEQPEAQTSTGTWCLYVAGMVGGWLGWDVDDERIPTVAKIIERRMWALPKPEAQQAAQELPAWESTTPVFTKFITQSRYARLRPNLQRFYKPFKCSNCETPQQPEAQQAAQEPRWPTTPDEVRNFIGSNYQSLKWSISEDQPHENDTYVLTVHDLLSAIKWWADCEPTTDNPPAPQHEAQEPYGRVTTHSVTGQQFFYRHPEHPYLDNASECVTLYTHPAPQQAAQEPVPGLERCEFDDECEFCSEPEGGVFTRLIHNAEDCTEAEFYICGSCLHLAVDRFTKHPAPQRQPLTDMAAIKLGLEADEHARHHSRGTSNWAYAITRFYEQAHGIKGAE